MGSGGGGLCLTWEAEGVDGFIKTLAFEKGALSYRLSIEINFPGFFFFQVLKCSVTFASNRNPINVETTRIFSLWNPDLEKKRTNFQNKNRIDFELY